MSYAAQKEEKIYTRPSQLGETQPGKTDLLLRNSSSEEDKGSACLYYLSISKKHTYETRMEETKKPRARTTEQTRKLQTSLTSDPSIEGVVQTSHCAGEQAQRQSI